MMKENVVQVTDRGLYCPAGDFYIDPSKPVKHAVITHAHGDHAREGSGSYYCSAPGEGLLRRRIGEKSLVTPIEYGKAVALKATKVTFRPAGHILGSSQVVIETGKTKWVISGDYKRDPDPTCQPFEVEECDTFITEATFALPVYRWEPTHEVAKGMYAWWEKNRALGKASVLFAYSLGKAQRILAELARLTDKKVFTHGAVESLVEVYRQSGVRLLPTEKVATEEKRSYAGELIIAPPSAYGSTWMRRFGEMETGFASGWMRIRGNRRRRGYERGFTLSDHADWPSLLKTIKETKARRVLVTHGNVDVFVRYLKENGVDAGGLPTSYETEGEGET